MANIERSIGRVEGKLDAMSIEISQLNQEMKSLRAAFDILEQGRLSGLEVQFATLNAQVAVRAKTTALWTSAVISGSITILTSIVIYIIK